MLEAPTLRHAPCQKHGTWSCPVSKARNLVMPHVKSTGPGHAPCQNRGRTTKPPCYQTCDVSAIGAPNVGKAPSDNLI